MIIVNHIDIMIRNGNELLEYHRKVTSLGWQEYMDNIGKLLIFKLLFSFMTLHFIISAIKFCINSNSEFESYLIFSHRK